MIVSSVLCFFFFFQAEDGIRDADVTGVQTCALPISQAARPYAEKMSAVISSLAGALKDNPGAPRLLTGTGSDQVQLVIVATADRGLCGGFNTNIVRRSRQLIDQLLREGKQVKIFCVGRKGRDQLRRLYGRYIIETVEFTGIKRVGFGD